MKISWYQGKKNITGQNIKALRKCHKLTQQQLAEQLQLQGYDFSALTVLRIEKGDRFIADYELQAIASYFSVTVDSLFD